MNIDILGISELTRTGMGEFNLDDRYIYYCESYSISSKGILPTVIDKMLI